MSFKRKVNTTLQTENTEVIIKIDYYSFDKRYSNYTMKINVKIKVFCMLSMYAVYYNLYLHFIQSLRNILKWYNAQKFNIIEFSYFITF